MQFFYQLFTLATIPFVAIALPTPAITIHEQVLSSHAFEPENKATKTIILKDLIPRNWLDDTLNFISPTEPLVVPLIAGKIILYLLELRTP